MRLAKHRDCRPDEPGAQGGPLVTLMIWATAATAMLLLAMVAAWPQFEIEVARIAIEAGAHVPGLAGLRTATRIGPVLLLVACLAGLGVRILRNDEVRRKNARGAALLILTFAIGPGLIVNGILKAHSHRPRPLHTVEVAGAGSAYRPFYLFDGACKRNCSFSSGETAAAFWTVAPALLAPPPLTAPAVVGALAFGWLVGAMRMLAGAHFLSDVAFSALLMLLLIALPRCTRRISG